MPLKASLYFFAVVVCFVDTLARGPAYAMDQARCLEALEDIYLPHQKGTLKNHVLYDLVVRGREGDVSAQSALAQRLSASLWPSLYRMTRYDLHEANALLEAILNRFFLNLNRIKPGKGIRGYLNRIARAKTFQWQQTHIRKKKRWVKSKRPQLVRLQPKHIEELRQDREQAERRASIREEELEKIQKVFHLLDQDDQELLNRNVFNEKRESLRGLAQDLGITYQAVQARTVRATQKLKDLIRRHELEGDPIENSSSLPDLVTIVETVRRSRNGDDALPGFAGYRTVEKAFFDQVSYLEDDKELRVMQELYQLGSPRRKKIRVAAAELGMAPEEIERIANQALTKIREILSVQRFP